MSQILGTLLVNTDRTQVIAIITSFIIWYIVDGHTAGVIVFTFIFVFAEFYFILAYPRFVIVALLSTVTQGITSHYLVFCQQLTSTSLDHWVRAPSQESWRKGKELIQ